MTMRNVTNNSRQAVVVGAGIGGLTLAYRLSQAGFQVSVYERSNNFGGLASPLDVGDVRVDRFYHTILSSDMSMQSLMREMGVEDKLHFTATKQGFYDDGRLYPFNTPFDLMSYPPLTLFQRFRLGLQVLVAQFERDAVRVDNLPVADWLNRVSGEAVYRKVWEPLLRAKFDSEVHDIPATYIWSRLRRMLSTRQGVTSKEMMCYLEGGYYTLVEALARKCEELGVRICLGTQVEKILLDEHGVTGVRVGGDAILRRTLPITDPEEAADALLRPEYHRQTDSFYGGR
jgi:protoporphyrinogen oxidase